jgi:exopolyphosphatase/guanosine-5'-triphosphate,3'-diphosphate pyrophosphatase
MALRALGERLGSDHALHPGEVLGAIDVGSNAVRLKLVRLLPDGAFEQLHQERDPVRPGEGVWDHGVLARPVVDRLVAALVRYAALCRRHRAGHVRAVATSALREARNRDEVVARVRHEAGLELEVIPGREEARLIGLGVLRGMPPSSRSLLVDIGGGSTEVARGEGEEPLELWSVPIGAVRLTEMFHCAGDITREQLVSLRRYAQRVVAEALPARIARAPRHAMGSSGTIRAVCSLAAASGTAHATRDQLSRAVEELARLSVAARRKRFDAQRADIVIAGAVILEALAHHLQLDSVNAVDGGLKEGLLVDLVRRGRARRTDALLTEAVFAAGRRFAFDEAHATHTREVALALFDQLESVHALPADCRLLLEVAAVLHDVGYAVNANRHHKHSQYLIQNMDLPGLSERERFLAAAVARFHRRSLPDKGHSTMEGMSVVEQRVVRALSAIVRLADGADHSRQHAVAHIATAIKPQSVVVTLKERRGGVIDAWDHDAEARLFRTVFGRRLDVKIVAGARGGHDDGDAAPRLPRAPAEVRRRRRS